MKEDKLTNVLVEYAQNSHNTIQVQPEHHYSYYGTRGVADIFLRKEEPGNTWDILREIKSRPKNANKVIRQFKKMINYFYKGTELVKPDNVIFELCFLATQSNFQHVKENSPMYQSVFENHEDVIITFRHPENTTPVHAFSSKTNIGEDDWWEHAKIVGNHTKLAGVKQ